MGCLTLYNRDTVKVYNEESGLSSETKSHL
jgi:hypothetical protein